MKIKTCKLDGIQLDWAVADAIGQKPFVGGKGWYGVCVNVIIGDRRCTKAFAPTIDAQLCDSVIETAKIGLTWSDSCKLWQAEIIQAKCMKVALCAEDRRVAALRCFVLCKSGPAVDVPDQLGA